MNAPPPAKDRCNQFHKLLLQLLNHFIHSSNHKNVDMNEKGNSEFLSSEDSPTIDDIFQVASLQRQLAVLQNSCVELENQLEEIAHARDEANESERHVRRALYRLASGRLKLSEVLQVSSIPLKSYFTSVYLANVEFPCPLDRRKEQFSIK